MRKEGGGGEITNSLNTLIDTDVHSVSPHSHVVLTSIAWDQMKYIDVRNVITTVNIYCFK